MRYVVAGNYQQYMRWKRDNNVTDPRGVVYVMDAMVLRGRLWYDGDQAIYVGTYHERPDYEEIQRQFVIMRSKGRHPSHVKRQGS